MKESQQIFLGIVSREERDRRNDVILISKIKTLKIFKITKKKEKQNLSVERCVYKREWKRITPMTWLPYSRL